MEDKWRNIEDLDIYELYHYLPKINCKRCGETTCLAFASKVVSGDKKIEQCLIMADNHSSY